MQYAIKPNAPLDKQANILNHSPVLSLSRSVRANTNPPHERAPLCCGLPPPKRHPTNRLATRAHSLKLKFCPWRSSLVSRLVAHTHTQSPTHTRTHSHSRGARLAKCSLVKFHSSPITPPSTARVDYRNAARSQQHTNPTTPHRQQKPILKWYVLAATDERTPSKEQTLFCLK